MRCLAFGRSKFGKLLSELKVAMCYGDIVHCHCPLDEIFVIPKAAPKVPFKKGPAEIYQRYVGETAKAHNRRVRKGGYLILAIPHRDLYEKKISLPSRWNGDHKHMFLIGRAEPPDTLDIVEEIKSALTGYDIKYIKACDEGHTITDPAIHSDGEYQIELVLQKIRS